MAHKFAERLRALRRARRLRQRELEAALSLRPGTESQYERGLREPGFDLLIAFADHFGVSVDYLLGRTEQPQGESGTRAAAVRDVAAAELDSTLDK